MKPLPEKLEWEAFEKPSYEVWMEQVVRELKGQPLESLHFDVAGEALNPFILSSDAEPPMLERTRSNWHPGVKIDASNPEFANEEVLNYLNLGASFIDIQLPDTITESFLDALFKEVRCDWIYGRLRSKNEELPAMFDTWAAKKGLDVSNQFFFENNVVIISPSVSDIRQAKELFTNHQKPLLVDFPLGHHFFENIAYARAIRRLWEHICPGQTDKIFIQAYLNPDILATDRNFDTIVASTQALSAALGMVDFLVLEPAAEGEDADFYKRIFLNIQHIMQMESHLGHVHDPMSGSYLIEKMTEIILQKAYEKDIDSQ